MQLTALATLPLSPRGQLTLPVEMRRALGLRPGDLVRCEIKDGGLVITAALVLPIEAYDAAREAEFAQSAAMTTDELAAARMAWGMP